MDAFRLDIPLGMFSGLTFVAAAGREIRITGGYDNPDRRLDASWYGSAFLARWFGHLTGWDFTLQAGKIYGGYQAGGGLIGEIKGLEIRAEAAAFWSEDSPALPYPRRLDLFEDHITAVFGLGYRFPNSLHLEMEYLYNGAGEDQDLDIGLLRQQLGASLHAGRHLLGLSASYELTPLAVGQVTLIHSLSDCSSQIQPTLNWSLTENAELVLGRDCQCGRPARVRSFEGGAAEKRVRQQPPGVL